MTEDEEELMIGPLDPSSSMVVIRDSPVSDDVVFPPIYHENLVVDSSIYGVDTYLESPSESSSPSSSSRHSGSSSSSSSSFSLFPSDSDVQPSEFDRKSPSETEQKSPPLLIVVGESPPSDSDKQPRVPSKQGGGDSEVKQLNRREIDVFGDWWELLLVRVYSKLKNLVTWFSVTLRPFYPVLAIAIWWWMRVRSRRRRVQGGTTDHYLRDAIKERDERIVQLLHQIAQMNELLIKHHKDIVSRR